MMAVSYKKLWHILLDRDMKKRDLQEAAGLTKYAMNKLSRDENVSTEVLGKICSALNCTTDDTPVWEDSLDGGDCHEHEAVSGH